MLPAPAFYNVANRRARYRISPLFEVKKEIPVNVRHSPMVDGEFGGCFQENPALVFLVEGSRLFEAAQGDVEFAWERKQCVGRRAA
jgi:hypothetical protein